MRHRDDHRRREDHRDRHQDEDHRSRHRHRRTHHRHQVHHRDAGLRSHHHRDADRRSRRQDDHRVLRGAHRDRRDDHQDRRDDLRARHDHRLREEAEWACRTWSEEEAEWACRYLSAEAWAAVDRVHPAGVGREHLADEVRSGCPWEDEVDRHWVPGAGAAPGPEGASAGSADGAGPEVQQESTRSRTARCSTNG
jgi:hypothetical protein